MNPVKMINLIITKRPDIKKSRHTETAFIHRPGLAGKMTPLPRFARGLYSSRHCTNRLDKLGILWCGCLFHGFPFSGCSTGRIDTWTHPLSFPVIVQASMNIAGVWSKRGSFATVRMNG